MKITKHAFTLVELIVVITILAILGTIGFVSLQGYSVNARDSVRISDTKTFLKALNIYQTKNGEIPLPDDMTTITGSGVVFSYQGTLSGSVIAELGQGQVPVDPLLKTPYLYATNEGRTKVQLLSYHEKNTSSLELQNTLTHADTTYADMFLKTMGDEIGLLLNQDKSPIGSGSISLSDTLQNYLYILGDEEIVKGSGSVLISYNPIKSCKRIHEWGNSYGSGKYTIYPDNNGPINVYCDMETLGGGWMLATVLVDDITKNLFHTGNSSYPESPYDTISSGRISNAWGGDTTKDILIQCRTDDDRFASYEIPFVIQDFPYSDIGNLEKDMKQGTTFSSTNLKANYNGNEIELATVYSSSSSDYSHYVRDSENQGCIAFPYGDRLSVNGRDNTNQNCPQYFAELGASHSNSTPFSHTNMCYTMIR